MNFIFKKIYILVMGVAFLVATPVQAGLIINEIMYDLPSTDGDREWVEVYNTGPDPVTIVGGSVSGSWRFVDNSAHVLNLATGDNTISPGQYAIIAKSAAQFASEWPSFSGAVFTSAISLPNTSATLSLRDGTGATISPVSYSSAQGAAGDGNSLQLSAGVWLAALPTPGLVNATEPYIPPVATTTSGTNNGGDNGSNTQVSGSAGGGSSSKSSPSGVLKVSAEIPRLASIQAPVDFFIVPNKTAGSGTRYYWSFGDGAVGRGELVTHVYEFAGAYTVVLTAVRGNETVILRAPIEIMEPQLRISATMPGPRGYVEIENPSAQEINLEGWQIASADGGFAIPGPTYLGAKQKLKLPNKVSKLNPMVDQTLTLSFPSTEVALTHTSPGPVLLAQAVENLKLAVPVRSKPAVPAPRVESTSAASGTETSDHSPSQSQLAAPVASGQKTVILGEKSPSAKWWQRLFSR